MPHYEARVAFTAMDADQSDTVHITIEANNAIHAKVLLQDQYGEKSVQSVKRQHGVVEQKNHAATDQNIRESA